MDPRLHASSDAPSTPVATETPPAITEADSPGVLRSICITVAAVTLGVAVSMRDGTYTPSAIAWLTASLVAFGASLAVRPQRRAHGRLEGVLIALLVLGIAAQEALGVFGVLTSYFPGSNTADLGHVLLLAGALFAMPLLLAGPSPRVTRVLFPMILLVWLAAGVWLIGWRSNPLIDVFMFQQDASKALLHGENPYRLTFPNPYGQDSPFYGPGVSVNNVLQFGYPYMPATLLMVLPAYAIAGDYRHAQLIALIGSVALVAYTRPSRISYLSAALLLTSPRNYYVVEAGWTEPLQLLLLTATVFCAVRRPRAMPYLLGILLASKLYMPFAVLLTPLLIGWTLRRLSPVLLRAALAGCVVSLPLILWDVSAFIHSAVTLQFRQPFRWDALSYLAWSIAGRQDAPDVPSSAWAFVAMAVATGVCLWRCPRSAGGFSLAIAAVYAAFFAFNKQAFLNYYTLVIGAACCAVATMDAVPGRTRDNRTS